MYNIYTYIFIYMHNICNICNIYIYIEIDIDIYSICVPMSPQDKYKSTYRQVTAHLSVLKYSCYNCGSF